MNTDDFFEYMDKVLGPVLEEYAKKRGMTLDELLLEAITLEKTGLFNCQDKQSVVYNRFKKNKINNLYELFNLYDNNNFNYGKDKIKNDYYIHNEIDGIINLLRYKYLGIKSDKLRELLNYKINIDDIDNFYMILKSCGFSNMSVKILIDIIYEQEIDGVILGDFLTKLSLDCVENKFMNFNKELKVCLNILKIIVDFHNGYDKEIFYKKC